MDSPNRLCVHHQNISELFEGTIPSSTNQQHTHTHQAAIQQFVKSETRVAQKRAFASLDDVAPGDPMLAFC